jgi:protein N-terminal amidase
VASTFSDLLPSPYKFKAPWIEFEFACHILETGAKLAIVSMAWSTRHYHKDYTDNPDDPDLDSLKYWLERLEPLICNDYLGEMIVVFANRCGSEGDALYVGTSCVFGIRNGAVDVYGVLGRGEERLLVVDTNGPEEYTLYDPDIF